MLNKDEMIIVWYCVACGRKRPFAIDHSHSQQPMPRDFLLFKHGEAGGQLQHE